MAFNPSDFLIPQGFENSLLSNEVSVINFQLQESILSQTTNEMSYETVPVDQKFVLYDSGVTILNPTDVAMLAPPAYETTAGSPASSSLSESLKSYCESPNLLLSMSAESSTASDDITSQVVSNNAVSSQRKRKRGGKPKSDGPILPKPKRQKLYEISHPFEDKEKERKRLSAINAKRHRDLQKAEKMFMHQQLNLVKSERDSLRKQVEELLKKEAQLKEQLSSFKGKVFSLWSEIEKEVN